MYKRFRYAIFVFAVVIAAMYVRAWIESEVALGQGRSEQANGDVGAAIESFRKAASWFAPGLSFSGTAYQALLAISMDEQVAQPLRIQAASAAKRGLRSSRSFLDSLLGRTQDLESSQRQIDASIAPANREHAVREAFPPHIDYRFQIIAQILFAAWVCTVLLGIWRGFNADGTMRRRELIISAAAWIVFFSGWLIALRFA